MPKKQIVDIRKYTSLFVFLVILLWTNITHATVHAQSFTKQDLAKHNTEKDCWVSFEGKVYDITKYLSSHDVYMDIRQWCGRDITRDFKTKAGKNKNHKPSSYRLLETYYIGDLKDHTAEDNQNEKYSVEISSRELKTKTIKQTNSVNNLSSSTNSSEKKYNILIPVVITLIAYFSTFLLYKSKKIKGFTLNKFNALWNTVLLLSLIPSLGFGILLMIRQRFAYLHTISFDFLYWHAELSLVMGTLAIIHFINRFKIYKAQLKH